MTEKRVWIWDGVGYLHGVPARDMTEREWQALTKDQRAALAPHYRKLKIKTMKRPDKNEAKET